MNFIKLNSLALLLLFCINNAFAQKSYLDKDTLLEFCDGYNWLTPKAGYINDYELDNNDNSILFIDINSEYNNQVNYKYYKINNSTYKCNKFSKVGELVESGNYILTNEFNKKQISTNTDKVIVFQNIKKDDLWFETKFYQNGNQTEFWVGNYTHGKRNGIWKRKHASFQFENASILDYYNNNNSVEYIDYNQVDTSRISSKIEINKIFKKASEISFNKTDLIDKDTLFDFCDGNECLLSKSLFTSIYEFDNFNNLLFASFKTKFNFGLSYKYYRINEGKFKCKKINESKMLIADGNYSLIQEHRSKKTSYYPEKYTYFQSVKKQDLWFETNTNNKQYWVGNYVNDKKNRYLETKGNTFFRYRRGVLD